MNIDTGKSQNDTAIYYSKRSQNPVSPKQRECGVAYPLKKFHNDIKRGLLYSFADRCNPESLLDLGVGRGGDVIKWFRIKSLVYGKGIDIADITEAKRRYEEICQEPEYLKRNLHIDFVQWSGLGESQIPDDLHMPYDIVTSMFACHYFFITKLSAEIFFKNVSSSLKEGGYFIGCIPDGQMILNLLKYQKHYTSKTLSIEKFWTGPPQPFGSPYTFSLLDTVTVSDKEDSPLEYLVFLDVFKQLAEENGLYPITNYSGKRRHFKKEDINSPFKHFDPSFKNSDPSLEMASKIYVAFAFQKKTKTNLVLKRKNTSITDIVTNSRNVRPKLNTLNNKMDTS